MIAGAAIGLAIVGGVAHGAYYRNSPIFGSVLGRLPGDARRVALTFDDGPNPDATPVILDVLAGRDVPATFFALGRHVQQWPELVSRAVSEGHAIGNHGFFHRKLHVRSPEYVRRDLELGTAAIQDACGSRPGLFRAPHGFRSPWVSSTARSLRQRTIGWTLGVWDSARPGVDAIVDRTIRGTTPGAILLLHDGDGYDPTGDRMQTARALPRIIDTLAAQGYAFASLADA
ncbi:MAG TPA: polysaccharide deacetylase family protein [Gemmatimonadaceae bacterium]|nr:polysaccharide deacetylase family protein [Gemmatimonadaceae bacterium]